MNDEINTLESVLPVTEPTLPRGRSILAWIVILGLVVFSVLFQRQRSEERDARQAESTGAPIMEMQGRMLVGLDALAAQEGGDLARQFIVEQLDALDTGPVGQRLGYLVLVGELEGPDKALGRCADLEKLLVIRHVELPEAQGRLLHILKQLYAGYQAGKHAAEILSNKDREFMTRELPWFGSLALAPKNGSEPEARAAVLAPAIRLAWMMTIGVTVMGLLTLVGLCAIIFVVSFDLAPRARQVQVPLPHAGVYAETFALWLALFWGLNLAVPYVPAGNCTLLVNGLLDLLSLSALAWPLVRGIPWSQVRAGVGLGFGGHAWTEPLVGVACYIMSLPFLAIGLAAVIALMHLQGFFHQGASEGEFGLGSQPTHPIVAIAAGADLWGRVQVVLLACVFAPILEETMFRGVLYGNLRGSTTRLGYWLSVLLSATVVSLIFAIIHPQGIIFVPALMSLAFGFALAREWRRGLVPGMVAHGLSNGLVMTLLMLGTGG